MIGLRWLLIGIVVNLLAALPAIEAGPYPIVRVVDGDTVGVTIDGQEQRVRLLWIDTPESHDNTHGEATSEGTLAARYLTQLLPVGTAIHLWGPGETLELDRYKRILAVVKTGEQSINLAMVTAGWTPYWRKYGAAPGDMDSAFMAAMNSAKTANLGAWATAPGYMRDKANETTAPKREK